MTTTRHLIGSAPRLARLGAVQVAATLATDPDIARGHVRVDVEVLGSSPDAGAVVEVTLVDREGTSLATGRSVAPPATDRPGLTTLVLDADGIRLWWPRSLGEPHRYDLRVRLLVDDVEVDRCHQRIGVRSIELDTSPDTLGAAFTFVVNGTPLFARGVTWWGGATPDGAPDDSSAGEADAEVSVRRLLAWMRDTEVDLVRVRGGEVDPAVIDTLLDACDELGVLVWFDLPSHTPLDGRPLATRDVVARARAHVGRLRHHPCLAIWCGGDEWGAAEALWSDDVPLVLEELDPDRPYWPGVPPAAPWPGASSDLHGCTQVWEPVDVRDRACRFVAALGLSARSAGAVPNPVGRSVTVTPLGRRRPCDGELAAARRVRAAIEHFRSMRGHCMGVVWSPTDVAETHGRIGHAAREAFADRLLTVQPRGRRLVVHVVNDARTTWWATGTATRTTFDGTVRIGQPFDVVVPPRSVVRVELDPCVAWARDPGGEVLAVEAGDAHTWWWFADDHELRLPDPCLAGTLVSHGGGRHVLTLTSTTVVRDLVVDPARIVPGASVDRPFVTMRPGRPERFLIETPSGTWPAHLDVDALVERSVIRWPAAPHGDG